MSYKIGVDGGGSKTECILVDVSGEVVARHMAPGCNPSLVGPDEAHSIVTTALRTVRSQFSGERRQPPQATLLCMAGSPGFWQEYAGTLSDFGKVSASDDSLPILELATEGGPGLVLHAGTGSFVAARAPDGSVHYAGGLGWRLDDPGSGYDIGKRAVARALLEFQGWAPKSGLSAAIRRHTGLSEIGEIMRMLYAPNLPNAKIVSFAPAVLELATEGDSSAGEIATASACELLDLARAVAVRLFPDGQKSPFRAGLSGPILSYPFLRSALAARSPFPLTPVMDSPTEGIRRMLVRLP
jgi:glucosamine kinase